MILFHRNNTYNWWEAQQFCEAAGGYLAQVGQPDEPNKPGDDTGEQVETEEEHQLLSWHYLTHWNWVGQR